MEFNNNKNYKVGYQNPPIETRFKKGVSGNRKGRPKGHKNFNTKLKYFLDGKISITNAGETVEATKSDAILLQLTNKAAQGDNKAIQTLLPKIEALYNADAERTARAFSKTDMEILKDFLDENANN